jgi:hypothetical protein
VYTFDIIIAISALEMALKIIWCPGSAWHGLAAAQAILLEAY